MIADVGFSKRCIRYSEIATAVRSLALPDRRTVTLFYLVGLSIEQVATELSVSLGTVKSRLNRSRKQLRKRMEDMTAPKQPHATDGARDVIAGMRGIINWDKLVFDDKFTSWHLSHT